MFRSKEQQFDFYWKEIFTGLAYNPIEFNTYRFDQTMSLPGKVNKLYDMFKVLAMNNQEVMDYLKVFVETFDFKLETTVEDVLEVWLEDGSLAEIIRVAINDEVIEARGDFASLSERFNSIDNTINRFLMKRDTDFSDLETAISYCNDENITLVLTKNHFLSSAELKEIPISNIIGNGFSIFIDKVHFTTNKPVTIKDIKFYHKTTNEKSLQSYCIKSIHTSTIINCYFRGFYSPCLLSNSNNHSVSMCVFERCMQGVYVRNSKYVNISNIYFNNTESDNNDLNNMISSFEGYDGALIENSSNVSVANSVFNWCIERTLYSSDSDNVTFTDNIINYSKCVKFCGYTAIRKSFICENIVVNNSFDDAFCQLYQCDNIIINNVNIVNENSYNVGWLIRAGQNISNVYVTNVKANRLRRNVIEWNEKFPTELMGASIVKNIHFENVTCYEIGLISGLSYSLFDFKYKTHVEKQISGLVVKNCTLLRSTTIAQNDVTTNQKGFSYVLSANTISDVLFDSNTISGYGANIDNKSLYPMNITSSYDNITIIADTRSTDFTQSLIPSIKLTARSRINILCNNTVLKERVTIQTKSLNNEEVDLASKYIIERIIYNINSTIFTSFKDTDIVYVDVYTDGEKGFISYTGVFKSSGDNVESGSWLSDGKVRLYVDTSVSSRINLRCNQTKQGKISISYQSS